MGGGVVGGRCGLNGSAVFPCQYVCFSVCVVHSVVRTFCGAADCPDYRITAVLDCFDTFKSDEGSNPVSASGDLYHSNPPLRLRFKKKKLI